jgi:hypothetical protein
MRGHRFTSRLAAAALLPVLALFAVSFTHDLMRCRLTGTVIDACVCAPGDAAAPVASTPAGLQSETCCARETIAKDVFVRGADEPPLPSAPLLAWTARLLDAERGFSRAALVGPARVRPTGPPLILAKQSFLL